MKIEVKIFHCGNTNQIRKRIRTIQYKRNKTIQINIGYPSLNIAIEYDENGHASYKCEEHEGRQKEIEKNLVVSLLE